MAEDELLRLDYAQTTSSLRDLTEIRFKLLAFVPTVAGTAVAFLRHPGSAAELLAVGLIGLTATIGILLYDLRNTELYYGALDRARLLEHRLGMTSPAATDKPGGPFTERASADRTVFGIVRLRHEAGLVAVYGAATGGWSYLVAWGALRAADVSHARSLGAAIGAVAGLAVIAESRRLFAAEPARRVVDADEPGTAATGAVK
jgi:hypothetical protein